MVLYRRSAAATPIETGLSCAEEGHGDLSSDAYVYACGSRAANTKRAYRSDLKTFSRWCSYSRQPPLPAPPSVVANYVAWLAKQGRKVATIERALAAISQAHVAAGFPSPRFDQTLRRVMTGVRRTLGVRPLKKRPVLVLDLHALIAAADVGPKGTRDRALLALGFAAALRRCELVSLDIADLAFTGEGLILTLRRSKTDQTGAGVAIGIPFGERAESCPVRLVRLWLDTVAAVDGPVFRAVNRHGTISAQRLSGKAVASVLKSLAPRAGLEPAALGAHSLRSGFVTSAMRARKPEHVVMRHSRHRSVPVFRGYVATAGLFTENAAAGIGI